MAKKQYQALSIDVLEFGKEDVVRCSGVEGMFTGEDIYNDDWF